MSCDSVHSLTCLSIAAMLVASAKMCISIILIILDRSHISAVQLTVQIQSGQFKLGLLNQLGNLFPLWYSADVLVLKRAEFHTHIGNLCTKAFESRFSDNFESVENS